MQLYHCYVLCKDLHNFPQLVVVAEEISVCDYVCFGKHSKFISDDFKSQFVDIINIDVLDWNFDSFITDLDQLTDPSLVEKFMLQHDNETEMAYRHSYQIMWTHKSITAKYPNLGLKIRFLFLSFLTSYLVEMAFSMMNHILKKS